MNARQREEGKDINSEMRKQNGQMAERGKTGKREWRKDRKKDIKKARNKIEKKKKKQREEEGKKVRM